MSLEMNRFRWLMWMFIPRLQEVWIVWTPIPSDHPLHKKAKERDIELHRSIGKPEHSEFVFLICDIWGKGVINITEYNNQLYYSHK